MEKFKEKITVGLRETLRAAQENLLGVIILAADTDDAFRAKILQAALKHNISVEHAAHSAELGKRACIERKAGVIGVFKTQDLQSRKTQRP